MRGSAMLNLSVRITKKILNLIAGIDEFKGAWKAIWNLAPERLHALKRVARVNPLFKSDVV